MFASALESAIVRVAQSLDQALPVRRAPVLTQLPLAGQTGNRDFKSHDHGQHFLYVRFRSIGNFPRLRALRFMLISESRHKVAQPLRIVNEAQ